MPSATIPEANIGGLSSHLESSAFTDPRPGTTTCETVMLSLSGRQAANAAIWAAILQNKIVTVSALRVFLARLDGADGAPRYRTWHQRLPDIGFVHTVIIAEAALPALVEPGQDFFVLWRPDEPRETGLQRFKAAWDRAIPHPAPAAWSEALIRAGRDAGLLRRLSAHGCRAVQVSGDAEAWEPVVLDVARLERGRAISLPNEGDAR